MRSRKRYYRRYNQKNRRWKTRKRKYRTQAKQYRTHTKRPIMGDRDWDSIFKFERKWGVMRRGRGWPKH